MLDEILEIPNRLPNCQDYVGNIASRQSTRQLTYVNILS